MFPNNLETFLTFPENPLFLLMLPYSLKAWKFQTFFFQKKQLYIIEGITKTFSQNFSVVNLSYSLKKPHIYVLSQNIATMYYLYRYTLTSTHTLSLLYLCIRENCHIEWNLRTHVKINQFSNLFDIYPTSSTIHHITY